MVEDITNILEKYGIPIHHSYSIDNYHYFLAEEMIITYDMKAKMIYVGFRAGCRAETAALNILALTEIKGVNHRNLEVTEDFIYDDNQKVLYGDEAYNYIHQRLVDGVLGQMFKEKNELEYLMDAKIEGKC